MKRRWLLGAPQFLLAQRILLLCILGLLASACLDDYGQYDFLDAAAPAVSTGSLLPADAGAPPDAGADASTADAGAP